MLICICRFMYLVYSSGVWPIFSNAIALSSVLCCLLLWKSWQQRILLNWKGYSGKRWGWRLGKRSGVDGYFLGNLNCKLCLPILPK